MYFIDICRLRLMCIIYKLITNNYHCVSSSVVWCVNLSDCKTFEKKCFYPTRRRVSIEKLKGIISTTTLNTNIYIYKSVTSIKEFFFRHMDVFAFTTVHFWFSTSLISKKLFLYYLPTINVRFAVGIVSMSCDRRRVYNNTIKAKQSRNVNFCLGILPPLQVHEHILLLLLLYYITNTTLGYLIVCEAYIVTTRVN